MELDGVDCLEKSEALPDDGLVHKVAAGDDVDERKKVPNPAASSLLLIDIAEPNEEDFVNRDNIMDVPHVISSSASIGAVAVEEKSDSPKVGEQVSKLKQRGKAFIQGLVDNWSSPSAASLFNGAVADASSSEQRERQTLDDSAAWRQILQTWTPTAGPTQRRLRNMCWRGIPSSCRGEAWLFIIGNELKVTNDLYSILRSRVHPTVDTDSCSREQSISLIDVDVPRTFPELQFFHGDGPLRAPLVNILKTYVSFRPDVGYIQGMSYIAAMLLLNLDNEFYAFVALANLLNRELYFTLFRDFRCGKIHLSVFEKLLHKTIPRVSDHFTQLGITSDMYLYDWLLTIFSRSFPIDIACRIWDCFLVDGQPFLFRAALGVLKMYDSILTQSNFEQGLLLLNHIPKNLDERRLFECIGSISFSEKSLSHMLTKEQIDNGT